MGVDSEVITGSYDLSIVMFSVLIAVIASYNVMNLADIAKDAVGRSRTRWLVAGSILMGFGIWTTHFVAMEAFTLPLAIRYDTFLTLISLLLAIITAFAALFIIRHPTINGKQAVMAGTILGVGISAMHYTGMAAMRLDAEMQYDLLLVAVSVVIAMAIASLSLWVFCSAEAGRGSDTSRNKMAGAVLMGSAIGGMHYTGMTAVTFLSTATPYQRTIWQFSELTLALLATVAMLLTLLVFMLNPEDLRRQIFRIAQKITLLSAVIILSAVVIVGQVAYKEASALLLELELRKTTQEIDLLAIDAKAAIANLQKDVSFLANTPPILGIIRADAAGGMDVLGSSTEQHWRERLQMIFSQFLLSRPEYMMIRFIGVKNRGQELVRVEYQANREIHVQPEPSLQQKAHRDYFIETLKVQPGEVYLSEINYDQEFGKLVEPYRPVMRSAIPVRRASGEIFGIVVINMDMGPTLNRLSDLDMDGDLDRTINDQGDYLVHPDSGQVFGFDLGEQHRVQDEFPELLPLLSHGDGQQAAVFDVNEHGNPMIAMTRKIAFDSLHPERFICLIELTSPEEYAERAAPILKRISIYGQFIIAFSILIAFFFSNLLMRPLRLITRATEAFADGSSRMALPLEDQSEIGDLARTFQAMTGQIEGRTEEMESAREILEKTFASLDSALFLVGASTQRVLKINRAACRIFGHGPEELLDQQLHLLFVDDQSEEQFAESMLASLDADGTFHTWAKMRRKDGREFPTELTVTEIRDSAGERTTLVYVIDDISSRKEAEQKLLNNYRMSKATTQALSVFVSQMDRKALFESILDDLNSLSKSEYGLIGVVLKDSEGKQYLKTLAVTNIAWNEETERLYGEQEKMGLEFNNINSLLGAVIQSGEIVIANEPATDPRRGGLPEGHPPLDAYLGYPLYLGDELVGMVGLANRSGGYDDAIISYLKPLMQACANVLGADINDQRRRKAEEGLRLSGQVFESALEGIVVTDVKGTIQSVNPAFTEITGYSEEEAVGSNPRMVKSEHHGSDFYQSMWKGILETGKWQGEIWNRRKSGETYPVWETITAIKNDEGETTLYVAIFFDITERKRMDEKLKHQAHHDVLTGLPNRMLFNDLLEQILKEEHRSHAEVAVLFMDLDRFKDVNDTLGHPIGDLLLQEAAKRLQATIRESDVLARMGGDEFTLILRDVSGVLDASHIAEKIIHAMNELFLLEGHEINIGASIGVSMFPGDAEKAETLIKYADTAMYRAKEKGRNNFQFFTTSMSENLALRLKMKSAIDDAIKNKEFELYFQPKVNLSSGECTGAEALIRWVLPNGELVMPDNFLPLAEETGQIIDIGVWVISAACCQLKAWHEQGYAHSMAVNLSVRQFESSDLIWQLTQALEASGVDASYLELEVTETCAMAEPEKTIQVLNSMRELGVKVSIDDFGTGYSSLSYLKKLPVNTLKVDRAFVRDIPEDSDDVAITTAVTQMASSLGLSVVAEGVETEGQANFLNEIGCEQAQGYYFSRPIPIDEYMVWLKERESKK